MRTKPEHTKKQYALGVALGFTLIVFGFWIASVSLSLSLDPEVTAAANTKSPIAALTANAGDAMTI
jgi:uncharacterized membrane protein